MARAACRRTRLLTWNAGHCCAAAMEANVDDVGFIGASLTRWSNGRAERPRLRHRDVERRRRGPPPRSRASTKLAAIAPVVGAVFGDEPPPRAPVPAFIIVGAEDQIRSARGRTAAAALHPRQTPLVGPRRRAGLAQASVLGASNGCGEPTRTQPKAASRMEWRQCRAARRRLSERPGNGHAWPGGEPGREVPHRRRGTSTRPPRCGSSSRRRPAAR